jgi:hypothetical protein
MMAGSRGRGGAASVGDAGPGRRDVPATMRMPKKIGARV